MKRILIFSVLLLTFFLSSIAQRKCGSEMNLDLIKVNNPNLYNQIMAIEAQTNSYISSRSLKSASQLAIDDQTTINIPVVVHVLYHSSDENISDQQIISQIAILNADYRRTNTDSYKTPSAFSAVASDFNI